MPSWGLLVWNLHIEHMPASFRGYFCLKTCMLSSRLTLGVCVHVHVCVVSLLLAIVMGWQPASCLMTARIMACMGWQGAVDGKNNFLSGRDPLQNQTKGRWPSASTGWVGETIGQKHKARGACCGKKEKEMK